MLHLVSISIFYGYFPLSYIGVFNLLPEPLPQYFFHFDYSDTIAQDNLQKFGIDHKDQGLSLEGGKFVPNMKV